MQYLTQEKLTIVGAGGAIGSNMAQAALMLKLTPNICLYDIYAPGVEGVALEMAHCGFEGANVTWTTDPAVAFKDAKYVISSGGAPRKDGMTREDLLKGNCLIAAQQGDYIREYCPDVKHVVVIFNPADITALTALIHSGLKPSQLTFLAALDSTRLQTSIASALGVPQDSVRNATTLGGHGEAMAVIASKVTVGGKPLSEFDITPETWAKIREETVQGGSRIIKLRGRSSFQSPAYHAVKMIQAAMGGDAYTLPAGCYVDSDELGMHKIMITMPTTLDAEGVSCKSLDITPAEKEELMFAYDHLCKMRDEIIELGIVPPMDQWSEMNPNL